MQAHGLVVTGVCVALLLVGLAICVSGSTRPVDSPGRSTYVSYAVVSNDGPILPVGALTVRAASGGPIPEQAPPTYSVFFKQTGLPSTDNWSATLNGSSEFDTADHAIVFTGIVAGVYPFGIPAVNGYSANPGFGNLRVVAKNVSTTIAFTPLIPPPPSQYEVTLVETGLKAGAAWSATVNGTTAYSTDDYVAFSLPNGTYAFGIGAINGYNANPSFGSIRVNGSAVSQPVAFTAITFLGLVPAEGYALLAGLVAVVVVVGAGLLLFLFRRWKRGSRTRPPPRPFPPPPPPAIPPSNPPKS